MKSADWQKCIALMKKRLFGETCKNDRSETLTPPVFFPTEMFSNFLYFYLVSTWMQTISYSINGSMPIVWAEN